MRLRDYFPKNSIVIKSRAEDWRQAVDYAMEGLLNNGYIKSDYIQAIKDSTLDNGPYYILAPYIAMPHTRPEAGAIKTGLTLTLLDEPVIFGDDQPIRLLIGLSAADSDTHIEAIQSLSELLCEDENIQALLAAKNEEQLADILIRA
ncbi:PTS mannitol transporter subunit IIA [Entomohabitans teleogrylli]|uniref:PTS mannitol transporter subunit IIA n=1 Tax=Entomohabitans teleogrylli TaxID=1384589 RepID=UPI00073D3A53|nr:PTS mannitol transporter subunit IIA [Entomohabitans teleogrylli]